jgi:hypothetical protein
MSDLKNGKTTADNVIEELTERYPGLSVLIADQINKEFEKRDQATNKNTQITHVPDAFSKWFHNLTTKARTFYSIAVAVPGLTTIASLMVKAFGPPSEELWLLTADKVLLGVLFLQSFFVFVLYFFIPKRRIPIEGVIKETAKPSEASTKGESGDFNLEVYCKAHDSSVEFSRMWRLAWLAWTILYFAWGCIVLKAVISGRSLLPTGGTKGWLETWFPLIEFFNNLSTVFLIMCYRELTFPTEAKREGQRIPLITLLTGIGFITVIEFIGGSDKSLSSIGTVLGWTGGFAAGAVIALLTGRLESKLINPPLVITVILYLYASIQATVSLFPEKIELMIIITSAAFLFKVIFFLLIHWLLSSGVLTFYLAEIGIRHKTTPDKRKRFVEAVQSQNLMSDNID